MILLSIALLGLVIVDTTHLVKKAMKKELIIYIILFVFAVGIACLCTMLPRKSSLFSFVLEILKSQQ